MSINTTSDFTLTRNELIELSMSKIGVTELSVEDVNLGVKVLNSLVRNLDAKGSWLWAIDSTESTLTTVPGQAEYVAGNGANYIATDILEVTTVTHARSVTDRVLLRILTKHEADRTYLKQDNNSSEPIACYLERANIRKANVLTIYPTPDAAFTIKYNYRRALYDFVQADNNPDLPTEWFLPLQKMLASELASHYGKPLQERQLLKMEADEAMLEVARFSQDSPSYSTLRAEYY